MKWFIDKKGINSKILNELKSHFKENNFSNRLIEILTNEIEYNPDITLKIDNYRFVESIAKQIIGLFYKNSINIDTIEDNHEQFYISNRILKKESNKKNTVYSKINMISSREDNTLSYHFHFNKNNNNGHLLLIYDADLM